MTRLPELSKKIQGECWIWPGTIHHQGYGRRKISGHNRFVHRVIFEALIGKVPDGLVLDHLCRVRACANPYHLEVVSIGENNSRGMSVCTLNRKKTHCKMGHPLSGNNLYTRPGGQTYRACKECRQASGKKY